MASAAPGGESAEQVEVDPLRDSYWSSEGFTGCARLIQGTSGADPFEGWLFSL